jgi:hypothetical protein
VAPASEYALGGGVGILDTTAIRTRLGHRPLHPTVYTAADAGVL